jgi:alkanesulfonate monooxygenase SsuD/methylene tetrahydromethanopterin reductase-like flavin-dependent oxidoreductase (luciferase family)
MNGPAAPMNELGFYTLPGAPETPKELIAEVREAEALGIGACFISERFNIKEAATLSGAVGAISERIGIATAATNHNTRHPMVTAAYAMTMHQLTGGRFSLGLVGASSASRRRTAFRRSPRRRWRTSSG